MNAFKILTAATASLGTLSLLADVPDVTSVTMTQAQNSREVTIAYTIVNPPAVITVDIQTNAGGTAWSSIGGKHIQRVTGDCWKKITGTSGTIKWQPDLDWPDHKITDNGARAVVTAWALDNTPNYMVVDLSDATTQTHLYYHEADFVPGGVLSNVDYRVSKLLMRKILSKGVTWTMGSVSEPSRSTTREIPHPVEMTNSYYIGVFPVTQSQWSLVQTDNPWPSAFKNAASRSMRPVDSVSYNEIRNSIDCNENVAYMWPHAPNPNSFLGKLNAKTGLAFELPSEAEWEYACRAGHGDGFYGNGAAVLNANTDPNVPGRYAYNEGWIEGNTQLDKSNLWQYDASCGTAICGSYPPNDWGLYDTHGNVFEWCLDWAVDDNTTLGARVNVDPENPQNAYTTKARCWNRMGRGGCWDYWANSSRSAARNPGEAAKRYPTFGLRVVCRAGLK